MEDGEITLHYDESGLNVRYYSLILPVNIEAYSDVLTDNLAALRRRLGAGHLDYIKLFGVLYTLKNIAPKQESAERADQIVVREKNALGALQLERRNETASGRDFGEIQRHQRRAGKFQCCSIGFSSQQWYRLSFWKVAAEELDYRRFFNINELISLRMEDEKVFRHTHALVNRAR